MLSNPPGTVAPDRVGEVHSGNDALRLELPGHAPAYAHGLERSHAAREAEQSPRLRVDHGQMEDAPGAYEPSSSDPGEAHPGFRSDRADALGHTLRRADRVLGRYGFKTIALSFPGRPFSAGSSEPNEVNMCPVSMEKR
jgi:hypothetical protein